MSARPHPTRWWNLGHVGLDAKRSSVLKKLAAECVEGKQSSLHSAHARTLPMVIEAFEQAGVPYVIEAIPGQGYIIKRWSR